MAGFHSLKKWADARPGKNNVEEIKRTIKISVEKDGEQRMRVQVQRY